MWKSGLYRKTALCLLIAFFIGMLFHMLVDQRMGPWFWAGALLVGSAAAYLIGWLCVVRTRRSARQLSQALQQMSQGRYGQQLLVRTQDEIGEVLHQFNLMSQVLAKQIARLDRDRQELRAVFRCMVEGVIVIDVQQRVQLMNEAACRLLKVTQEGSLDRLLWEIVRHRPLVDAAEAVLSSTEPYRCELELIGRESKVLAMQGAPLVGPPLRGAVLVLQDITELRRLEQVRREFAANVSHELKTPLAAIQACVETLLDGAMNEPQPQLRFLHNVRDNAERLHVLVQDLLALNRIESGQEAFEILPIDIQPIIEACLARHEPQATARHIRLEWTPPVKPIVILADEEAMDHILDNLVDNAIKYTPEGGRITLQCEEKTPWAYLRVKDTGCGIPEKDLHRIFERFYRVDKARSREMGGTGLGLSIVKHMVQALHGKVTADSTLNEGSCFTVMLPLAQSNMHMDHAAMEPRIELVR